MPLRISREGGTTFRRSRMVKMYSPAMGGQNNRKGVPAGTPSRVEGGERSAQVSIHQLGHVEHRDLALAAEHRTELVVRVDGAPVLGVLQAVPLDVGPELLGHFGAGYRVGA